MEEERVEAAKNAKLLVLLQGPMMKKVFAFFGGGRGKGGIFSLAISLISAATRLAVSRM